MLANEYIPALRYGAKILSHEVLNLGRELGRGRTFYAIKAGVTGRADFTKDHSPYNGITPVSLTVEASINKTTANFGDVIYALPGHTEDVTLDNWNADVAAVSTIGIGIGATKPTFSFGVTSSRVNLTAADCSFENMRFTAAVGDVVTAFLHATAAENSQFIDIEYTASSTFNFINQNTLGAANISDGCTWVRNYVRTADTGQFALVITAASHNDLKFYNNFVLHNAALPGLLSAAANNLLGLDVKYNFVQTLQTDGSVGVLVVCSGTASSGNISENHMKTTDDAANVAIPIASKVYAANNYIDCNDEVGTIIGVGTLFNNA